MANPARGRFTGELAKPMPRLGNTPPTQWLLEHRRRMELLREQLGFGDHDDWYMVACELAQMIVPGLREGERRAGAPTKWSNLMLGALKSDVDALREAHPHWSILRACQKLAKEEYWQAQLPDASAATLQRRYHDCTPKMLALWKEAVESA